jgi:hypothetical protein
VLSHVAPHLGPEQLALAIDLAQTTWPSPYNSLHIFLGKLPTTLLPAALQRLAAAVPSLDPPNKAEVVKTLELYLRNPMAAVALLEYETTRDPNALARFVHAAQVGTPAELLQTVEFLRAPRIGWHEVPYQEAEYQLFSAYVSRSPAFRSSLLDHIHTVLDKQGRTRPSLLKALESLGPSLRVLASADGADRIITELLQIENDWA